MRIYMKVHRPRKEITDALPAVAVAVTMAVPAVVLLVHLVVDSLHDRYGVCLDDVHWHLNVLHYRHLHYLLNRDGAINVDVDNLFHWHPDDLLNWVGHWFVYLHLLDLDDGYGNISDDWNLDRIGLGYWHLHLVGLGHGVGLGHSVGHLTEYLVGFLTDAVASRGSVVIGQTVNVIDDWVLGSRDRGITASRSR